MNRTELTDLLSKAKAAREFWISPYNRETYCGPYVFEKRSEDCIHVREILPTDLTPDQVIERVCEFLKQFDYTGSEALDYEKLIRSNKENILKFETENDEQNKKEGK